MNKQIKKSSQNSLYQQSSKNTVLYTRFNDSNRRVTSSLDTQLKEAKAFIYSRGWKLDKIFIDTFNSNNCSHYYQIKDRAACKSRKNYPHRSLLMPELVSFPTESKGFKKRIAFNDMLSYIKDNPVNVLLTSKLERLFGNFKEMKNFIDNVLNPRGIAIQSINENFNSHTPEGIQFLRILDSFSEFNRPINLNKYNN